jgi:hypothetical protein
MRQQLWLGTSCANIGSAYLPMLNISARFEASRHLTRDLSAG